MIGFLLTNPCLCSGSFCPPAYEGKKNSCAQVNWQETAAIPMAVKKEVIPKELLERLLSEAERADWREWAIEAEMADHHEQNNLPGHQYRFGLIKHHHVFDLCR